MSLKSLEDRVAKLERQLAALRSGSVTEQGKDWRRTVGMFSGDELMKKVDAEAKKIRERDRRQTRPKRQNATRVAS